MMDAGVWPVQSSMMIIHHIVVVPFRAIVVVVAVVVVGVHSNTVGYMVVYSTRDKLLDSWLPQGVEAQALLVLVL